MYLQISVEHTNCFMFAVLYSAVKKITTLLSPFPMTCPLADTEKETAVYFWSLLRLPPRSAAESSAAPSSQPPIAPAGRSSKTSLGFISTPLIWPVRKKPETTVTQAPKYPAIHMTKAPPLPTKSMADMSPEPRIPKALTNAKKTNFTTRRPAYSHVLWPHNQTEKVDSFQVVSVSNRKSKPLTPQWDLSDSSENSSEELDFPSGFGSEAFLYDIDLDENIFSLFEFDATYSLDEGLATTSPNISLLETASVPTTDNTPFKQAEMQTSVMLIKAPRGSDVQMNQSGLSRLTGQTTEPAISPTHSSLMSTVRWDLPEVTGSQCSFTDVNSHQQMCTKMLQPTVIAHGTLEEAFSGTETQNKFIETTSSIAASLKYSSDYTLFRSYPLRVDAPPTLYISQMPAMEVQHEYTIRLSSLAIPAISSATILGAQSQSQNLFISTQNLRNHNLNSLITPQLVASYLVTEGTIALSLVTSQSTFISLQVLEPSRVNRPLELLYGSLNRQTDNDPLMADEQGLSYAFHISVRGSSELRHAATPVLTDEWGSSSSSTLHSSFVMGTERDDGLPMFSSTSENRLDSSFMSLDSSKATEGGRVTEMGGDAEIEAALSDFRSFTVLLPSPSFSHTLPLDFQREPSLDEDDIDDSENDSVMLHLSNILTDESIFPQDSDESTTIDETQPFLQIYRTTSTTTSTDTDDHPINPTSTYFHDTTVVPKSFYSHVISGIEHTRTITPPISPSKRLSSLTPPITSISAVYVPHLANTESDHMSGFSQVISGFHHASTFSSRLSWPSTLEPSVHSLGLDVHPVDPSIVNEDLQDTKHAQFSTTEQLFWSENESAKPPSNSNSVLIVRPITTDREMHPSPPAAYHQSFVSTNGTLPLASPPKGVIADVPSVPTEATHGSTTDSPEFIPCPCNPVFYSSCHCGLSAGNSMFFNNDLDLRKRSYHI